MVRCDVHKDQSVADIAVGLPNCTRRVEIMNIVGAMYVRKTLRACKKAIPTGRVQAVRGCPQ